MNKEQFEILLEATVEDLEYYGRNQMGDLTHAQATKYHAATDMLRTLVTDLKGKP